MVQQGFRFLQLVSATDYAGGKGLLDIFVIE